MLPDYVFYANLILSTSFCFVPCIFFICNDVIQLRATFSNDAIFCLPRVQRSVVLDCYLFPPAVYSRQGVQCRHFVCAACTAFCRIWLLSVPLLYRKGPLLPLHRPVGDPSPQPAHRHDGRHLCQGECMPRSPLWFNKIMPKRIWVA